MKSVDERLASVLLYLCKKGGFSPVTLATKDGAVSFSADKEEIKKLKETVLYLKEYAKVKALTQAIAEGDSFEENIRVARENIMSRLDELKAEYENLPRKKTVRKKENHLYGFEDQIAAQEAEEVAKFNEQLEEAKSRIKDEVAKLKEKLKKLDTLQKNIGNPKKIMEILFEGENAKLESARESLIDACARVMIDGQNGKHLVGEDKVFRLDEATGKYVVNPKAARQYISTAKKGKAIIQASEYLKANKDKKELEEKLERDKKKLAGREELAARLSEPEYREVHEFVNSVASHYDAILRKEDRLERRSIVNKIRNLFGFESRGVSRRRTFKERAKLEMFIRSFLSKTDSNPTLRKAYEEYVKARGELVGQDGVRVEDITIAASGLVEGITRITLPRYTISEEDFRIQANNLVRLSKQVVDRTENDLSKATERAETLRSGLSKTAQKLVEERPESEILDMYATYYAKEDKRKAAFRRQTMSNSSAIMILESLVSGRKVTFEQICERYGGVLGEATAREGKIDMDRAYSDKVDEMRKRIAELYADIEGRGSKSQVPENAEQLYMDF